MNKFKYGLILLALVGQLGKAQNQKEQIIPLDSAFALAERNSTFLKITKSVTETANQSVEVVKSQQLPSVEVGLTAMYLGNGTISARNFSNSMTASIPDFGNNFSIEASYVVFSGRAISNSIKKTKLEAQVASLAHEKNAMDIRFLVAGNYLNLFKLYNQKKVFIRNIEQTNEVIKQVKAKLAQGMALDSDLTRYELMLQNLHQLINKHVWIIRTRASIHLRFFA